MISVLGALGTQVFGPVGVYFILAKIFFAADMSTPGLQTTRDGWWE